MRVMTATAMTELMIGRARTKMVRATVSSMLTVSVAGGSCVYHIGDAVKVYYVKDKQWYAGAVDKLRPQTIQVYYDESDTFTSHKRNDANVQLISNIDGNNDSDDEDDERLGVLLRK